MFIHLVHNEDKIISFLYIYLQAFLHKQHFYKQRQAEIGKKNQANAKQHREAELLLFENSLLFSSTLSSKNSRRHFQKMYKKQKPLFKCAYMINDSENEAEFEK